MSKLYHFTKLSALLDDILPNQRLLMNYITKSNDPWENQLFSFETKWKSDPNSKEFNYFSLQSRLHEKIKLSSRMTSFSLSSRTNRSSNPGYNLSRMWAQYGDNHKGVCIILNKEDFLKENVKKIDFKNRIQYKSEIRPPLLDEKYSRLEGYKEIEINRIISKFRKEIFFTKLNDWKGENEFRIINYKKTSEEYCSIKNSLYGIILGINSNKILASCILNFFKPFAREIHLFKAHYNYSFILNEYNLVFENILDKPCQIDD
jgi:hypothetical protein